MILEWISAAFSPLGRIGRMGFLTGHIAVGVLALCAVIGFGLMALVARALGLPLAGAFIWLSVISLGVGMPVLSSFLAARRLRDLGQSPWGAAAYGALWCYCLMGPSGGSLHLMTLGRASFAGAAAFTLALLLYRGRASRT